MKGFNLCSSSIVCVVYLEQCQIKGKQKVQCMLMLWCANRVQIETVNYSGFGPSIVVDVSMANQVEHWIHSVLVVLPDPTVVSSIPDH